MAPMDESEEGEAAQEPTGAHSTGAAAETTEPAAPPEWHWKDVQDHIFYAQSESEVLLDLFALTRNKKYLAINHTTAVEAPVPDLAFRVVAKRQLLANAAEALASAAARLENALETEQSFYSQLTSLQQDWRIVQRGQTLGFDVGLRSAGSRHPGSGLYSIRRGDTAASVVIESPPDLQTATRLRFSVSGPGLSATSTILHPPFQGQELSQISSTLEAAQHSNFLREIFSALTSDALEDVSNNANVVGHSITATVDSSTRVQFDLVSSTDSSESSSSPNPVESMLCSSIETFLAQQVRKMHLHASNTLHFPSVYASSRPAPQIQHAKIPVLAPVLAMTRHWIVRQQVAQALDNLSSRVSSIHVATSWMSSSSLDSSTAVLTLGTELLHPGIITIHIQGTQIRCHNSAVPSTELLGLGEFGVYVVFQVCAAMASGLVAEARSLLRRIPSDRVDLGLDNISEWQCITEFPRRILHGPVQLSFRHTVLNRLLVISFDVIQPVSAPKIVLHIEQSDGTVLDLLSVPQPSRRSSTASSPYWVHWSSLPGQTFHERCRFLFSQAAAI
ncbi:hypothetical protein, variant [Capsaspora owczarzaki ATCC 30864]|nr:hypothetical protein, variant [Capsaspora owczarzaki ATCC 30864]